MKRFSLLLLLLLYINELNAKDFEFGLNLGFSGNKSTFILGDVPQSPFSKPYDGATGLGLGLSGGPEVWYHLNDKYGLKFGLNFLFTIINVENRIMREDGEHVFYFSLEETSVELPLQMSYNINKRISVQLGASLRYKIPGIADYFWIGHNIKNGSGSYYRSSISDYIIYDKFPDDKDDYVYSYYYDNSKDGTDYSYKETQYFYQKRLDVNLSFGVSYRIKQFVMTLETAYRLNNPMPSYESNANGMYTEDKLRTAQLELSCSYYFKAKK